MKYLVPLLVIASTLLSSCGEKTENNETTKPGQDAHHAHEGPHGGELIELGAHVAHMEVLHNHDASTVTLYSFDGALKPIKLDKAPMINFIAKDAPKQVTGVPAPDSTSQWIFTDEAFKGEPKLARFRIVLGGVTYSPDVPHHH